MRADGFEDGHDVQLASVAGDAAGQNRAAVDKHARAVHARHGHHAGGHVFVATADGHEAVHALAADNRLDGIGNHLAADERIFHALRAHRNAIGNGDGVKNNRLAAGRVCAALGFLREQIDVHIARGDIAPSGGDADDWLFKITGLEASRIKHRATGCTVWAIEHDSGVWAEVGLFAHKRRLFSRENT